MPGPTISASISGPNDAYTFLYDYAGGTSLTYIGKARSNRHQNTPLTDATVSAAAAAVVTYVAHGLATDNLVTFSGAIGDWAALNGSRKITRIDADTFSVAVDSSGFTGTFAGTVTTYAPQTSAAIWSIQKFYYDASNTQTRSAWAEGNAAEAFKWDDIATLAFQ